MYIKSIDLLEFRNYERLHMDLPPGVIILYGDNAQGKTNLLEACYMASTGKSHRASKDRELIRFEQEESHIKVICVRNDTEYRIDLHLRKNKNKGIAVNGVPIRRTGDFIGTLSCILFSPEDLQIVKNGPQERRRFIDGEICQLDKIYLDAYSRYKKTLEQRNQLLKDIYFNPGLRDTLDIWDDMLIASGTRIIQERKKFISELSTLSGPVHAHLSGGKETLKLIYEKDTEEETFRDALRANRERDLKQKTTSVGPHRDDIRFEINGIDARTYGSQGQQRTAALSVKLAEIELVKKRKGENPILLLDDVLSELDSGRQAYLLESIRDIQTIITCTGLEDFINNRFPKDHVYRIIQGHAEEMTEEV